MDIGVINVILIVLAIIAGYYYYTRQTKESGMPLKSTFKTSNVVSSSREVLTSDKDGNLIMTSPTDLIPADLQGVTSLTGTPGAPLVLHSDTALWLRSPGDVAISAGGGGSGTLVVDGHAYMRGWLHGLGGMSLGPIDDVAVAIVDLQKRLGLVEQSLGKITDGEGNLTVANATTNPYYPGARGAITLNNGSYIWSYINGAGDKFVRLGTTNDRYQDFKTN